MSMIDGFFNKGFKASKGKTLLKLTIPRIKLLRNKKEVQIKQMRRDISKLLQTGQEPSARIRVEHIIREENMMAAHEIIELFCELISVRLPIIETQRECPLDLKESISSLCFAAPRCTDLPELLQLHSLFTLKYGKDFASAASQLLPNCGVNRQLIEHLSVRPPSPARKLKLLKEIADEFEIEWDPAISQAEFSNPPYDLLNGPSQFLGGFRLPIEKRVLSEKEESVLEMLDLPEVPWDSPKGVAAGVLEVEVEAGENGGEEEDKWVGRGVDMVELKDVLDAAKTATETAERAAAASREAQVRIKEIIKKREEDGTTRDEEENPFYEEVEDGIFSYPDLFSRGPNVNPGI